MRSIILGFLAAIFMVPAASAYDMKPIVIQLRPSGAGSSQSVVITNTHAQPIAIEVRAFSRSQNPDGTETRVPEERDIIISPPQMVIPSKSSQSFKVQWVGDAAIEKELAFRLISTQLPIRFQKEEKEGVNIDVTMNYTYEAALYVVPPKSQPAITLSAAQYIAEKDGGKWLELDLASTGSRRAILTRPKIIVKAPSGGQSVTLEGDALASLENLNILAGSTRVLRLPWPGSLTPGPVTAEIQTSFLTFD